ncbi:MAG: hypothetical protein ACLPKI_08840 [Streptosporangiaceae bacterium]
MPLLPVGHSVTYFLNADSDVAIDAFGGGSAVIDYRGQILGRHGYSGGRPSGDGG